MSVKNEIIANVGSKVALGAIALLGGYLLVKYLKSQVTAGVASIGEAIGDAAHAVVNAPAAVAKAVLLDPVTKPAGGVGAPSYAGNIDIMNNPYSFANKKNSTSNDNANDWAFYQNLPYNFDDADPFTKETLKATLPAIFN